MLFLYQTWIIFVSVIQVILTQTPCTLPSQFQNSVWVDSDKGDITFGTTNMTGWGFVNPAKNIVNNQQEIVEEWECFHTGTVGSKFYLIFKCSQNITFNGDFTPYLCMELSEVSTFLFYYYLIWAEQEGYQNERITTFEASRTVTDAVQELCLDTTKPDHVAAYPDVGEYHVLVKKGNELDAKQECPSTFFGEYYYNITDIVMNNTTCGSGDEVWDVCTDYTRMSFNYSICSTKVAYSANGSVFCLVNITSGNYIYHTVYNEDNEVDELNTYRFTCFMSEISSDGSLRVSQTPESCKKGQTTTTQPVLASTGLPAGLNMHLSPRVLCPKTNTSASSGGLSPGVIVGIVLGVLIFIVVIILIILCCKKMNCRLPRRSKNRSEKDETPALSPRVKQHSFEEMTPVSTKEDNNSCISKQTAKQDDDNFNSQYHAKRPPENQKAKENTEPKLLNDNSTQINVTIINEMNVENSYGEINGAACDTLEPGEVLITDNLIQDLKTSEETKTNDDENKEIKVTRLVENKTFLKKDMPHLNSTENIFSGYDAAMTYKTNDYGLSKSEFNLDVSIEGSIKQNRLKTNVKTRNEKDTIPVTVGKVKPFEYTRDDSDLQLQSKSKEETNTKLEPRMYKSEGNLHAAVKGEMFRRKSSLISGLTNGSIQWNFTYTSPYALSDKQKEEMLRRKVRLARKRKQQARRKQEDKEKKIRENTLAFQKWMLQKKENTVMNAKMEPFGRRRPDKYQFWYPV